MKIMTRQIETRMRWSYENWRPKLGLVIVPSYIIEKVTFLVGYTESFGCIQLLVVVYSIWNYLSCFRTELDVIVTTRTLTRCNVRKLFRGAETDSSLLYGRSVLLWKTFNITIKLSTFILDITNDHRMRFALFGGCFCVCRNRHFEHQLSFK